MRKNPNFDHWKRSSDHIIIEHDVHKLVNKLYLVGFSKLHVLTYSPAAGADNPLRTFFYHKHKSSVHLHSPNKFPPI